VVGRQRLGARHVEGRADPPRVQALEQRVLVDVPAAGGVDEQGAGLHRVEEGGVDDPRRRVGQREQHDDDVRLRHQRGDVGQGALARPRHPDGAHAERRQARLERPADRAVAEEQHRLAVEVVDRADRRRAARGDRVHVGVPLAAALERPERRQPALHREDHRRAPLGHRPVVDRRRVGHGHALGHEREQPLVARRGRLDDLERGRGGEHLAQPRRGQRRPGDEHPRRADAVRQRPLAGDGDDLDLVGQGTHRVDRRTLRDEHHDTLTANQGTVP
jgi:hypothetical protein